MHSFFEVCSVFVHALTLLYVIGIINHLKEQK
jgi:hypothetical protein